MIHACRAGRCYKKGTPRGQRTCKYGYAYPVNPVTYVDENGRVQYRRRSAADALVVPYNAFLLLKYDAHINVEIAHTTM